MALLDIKTLCVGTLLALPSPNITMELIIFDGIMDDVGL